MLPLGEVFCTMEALYAFAQALDEEPNKFLARHANGDWGELDERDRKANKYALGHGLRVLSALHIENRHGNLGRNRFGQEFHNNTVARGILMSLYDERRDDMRQLSHTKEVRLWLA